MSREIAENSTSYPGGLFVALSRVSIRQEELYADTA
jgi:hypothetical protein